MYNIAPLGISSWKRKNANENIHDIHLDLRITQLQCIDDAVTILHSFENSEQKAYQP